MAPAVAMDRPVTTAVGPEITQPPNSPVQGPKALVDLTDSNPASSSGGNKADSGDSDLEKAIKLSLQEAQKNTAVAAMAFGGSNVTQEDQDVSRALEASLLESTMNGAKRKRGETWVDPLNPHERERNGTVRQLTKKFISSTKTVMTNAS
jgi:hypothetical protein